MIDEEDMTWDEGFQMEAPKRGDSQEVDDAKWCVSCKKWKSVNDFYPSYIGVKGFPCKACSRKRANSRNERVRKQISTMNSVTMRPEASPVAELAAIVYGRELTVEQLDMLIDFLEGLRNIKRLMEKRGISLPSARPQSQAGTGQ